MRSAPGPGPMRQDNFGLCSNKPVGQSPGILESGRIYRADQNNIPNHLFDHPGLF